MSKTIKISDDVHRLLKTYKLNLSAVREEQQSFDDAIMYLIHREAGKTEPEVEVPNE